MEANYFRGNGGTQVAGGAGLRGCCEEHREGGRDGSCVDQVDGVGVVDGE